MKDCHLVKHLDDADSKIYCDIFHDTYEYHHEHQHVYNGSEFKKHGAQLSGLYGGEDFQDPDPWTGIQCERGIMWLNMFFLLNKHIDQ